MRLIVATLLGGLLVATGCDSNNTKGNGNDLSGSVGDGGEDGGGGDASANVMCALTGAACADNSGCCSNNCDATNKVCLASTTVCKNAGDTCAVATDCCNLDCTGGTCAQVASCIGDNAACGGAVTGVCCSGTCGAGGTCTPLNTMCLTAGNPCVGGPSPSPSPSPGQACCSGLCTSGKCALAASFCTQVGDICYRSSDCCTGVCNATGGAAGTCQALNSPVSCSIDGTICNGCGSCCSRLCAPYAQSGVDICQPASGCKVYGDLCKQDSDCCGGEAKTALPPGTTQQQIGAGLVKCTMIAGAGGIGYCDHPTPGGGAGISNCNPEGDICHFQNYACSISSARDDCCACISSKDCCRLDSVGIPRCGGIGNKDGGIACVPTGGVCTFNGDCCNNAPCVPDSTGTLRCGAGTDGGSCVPVGGPCTTTGDCCLGVTCTVPPGSLLGVCQTIIVGNVGDGGVPADLAGAPVCAQIGQSCATSACCTGLNCNNPTTGASCGATGAGCICQGVIM